MAGRAKGKKGGKKAAVAKKIVEPVEDEHVNSEEETETSNEQEVEDSAVENGDGFTEVEDGEDLKTRGKSKKAAKRTPAKATKGKRGHRSAAAPPAKKTKKAQSEEEDDDKEYEVDEILAVRVRGGKRVFSIKWKGYSVKNATWEPEENLTCQELLDEFLSRNPEDDVPRTRGLTSKKKERQVKRSRVSAKKGETISKKYVTISGTVYRKDEVKTPLYSTFVRYDILAETLLEMLEKTTPKCAKLIQSLKDYIEES